MSDNSEQQERREVVEVQVEAESEPREFQAESRVIPSDEPSDRGQVADPSESSNHAEWTPAQALLAESHSGQGQECRPRDMGDRATSSITVNDGDGLAGRDLQAIVEHHDSMGGKSRQTENFAWEIDTDRGVARTTFTHEGARTYDPGTPDVATPVAIETEAKTPESQPVAESPAQPGQLESMEMPRPAADGAPVSDDVVTAEPTVPDSQAASLWEAQIEVKSEDGSEVESRLALGETQREGNLESLTAVRFEHEVRSPGETAQVGFSVADVDIRHGNVMDQYAVTAISGHAELHTRAPGADNVTTVTAALAEGKSPVADAKVAETDLGIELRGDVSTGELAAVKVEVRNQLCFELWADDRCCVSLKGDVKPGGIGASANAHLEIDRDKSSVGVGGAFAYDFGVEGEAVVECETIVANRQVQAGAREAMPDGQSLTDDAVDRYYATGDLPEGTHAITDDPDHDVTRKAKLENCRLELVATVEIADPPLSRGFDRDDRSAADRNWTKQGEFGELAMDQAMNQLGFSLLGYGEGSGIDGLYQNALGEFAVVEAKFGSSGLSPDQMSDDWVLDGRLEASAGGDMADRVRAEGWERFLVITDYDSTTARVYHLRDYGR